MQHKHLLTFRGIAPYLAVHAAVNLALFLGVWFGSPANMGHGKTLLDSGRCLVSRCPALPSASTLNLLCVLCPAVQWWDINENVVAAAKDIGIDLGPNPANTNVRSLPGLPLLAS